MILLRFNIEFAMELPGQWEIRMSDGRGHFGPLLCAGRLLLIGSLVSCAGLSAGPRSPIGDVDAATGGLQAVFSVEAVNKCLGYSLETEEPQARNCRDTIVQALMISINLRYAEYELGFFDADRYARFAATVTALGLSTAGAVSGVGTAQALSAAAAGVTGTRAAFSREVLQEQTSAALLTAMRSQRETADLRVRNGLRRSARDYPLGVALSDVYAFYRAGTVPGAIAGVTQAVGVQAEAAQERLVVGTGLARSTAAVALRRWVDDQSLTPAEAAARRRAVRDAARQLGFGEIVIASFLRDESPQGEERLTAVARRLRVIP